MSDSMLAGLVLPEKLPRGRPSPDDVAPWLEVVGELLSRGVKTPGELKRLLGIGHRTAERWLEMVHAQWAASLDDERVNYRREALYREADAVARVAWSDALNADTAQARSVSLKLVIEANKRKASLTGLDRLEVKIDSRIEQQINVDVVASVEADFGLAPGALEQIGRDASLLLSRPEIIDIEGEE